MVEMLKGVTLGHMEKLRGKKGFIRNFEIG